MAPRVTAPVATRDETEHYLWFPEQYCRRCKGGRGALCEQCEDAEAREYETGVR